jgi:Family of unknown function (DUF5678)
MSASLPNRQNESRATTAKTPITSKEQESVQEERPQLPYRHRELEWLRTHKEALQKLAGQWIVVEGEEIITSGDNPLHVVAEARAKGIQIPYVIHLGVTRKDEVRIGL